MKQPWNSEKKNKDKVCIWGEQTKVQVHEIKNLPRSKVIKKCQEVIKMKEQQWSLGNSRHDQVRTILPVPLEP